MKVWLKTIFFSKKLDVSPLKQYNVACLFLTMKQLFIFLCFCQVPNYYKVIVHPMDLSNIRAKLQTQNFAHYQTFHDFVADCRLIFENCAIFNEVSADVIVRTVLIPFFYLDMDNLIFDNNFFPQITIVLV